MSNMMKFRLTCTNAEEYLKGNYSHCFALFPRPTTVPDWIDMGEVTVDIAMRDDSALAIATKDLDDQLLNARRLVQTLEDRKADLLALPSPGKGDV